MHGRRRAARRGLLALMTMGLTVTIGAVGALGASLAQVAYPAPVMVYPSPGDRYEQRATQISFRGIPAALIGSVQVVGSRSGMHAGRIEADSDGEGASFIPSQRFAPGETVTVTTGLDIIGGDNGLFRFRIDHPRPFPSYRPLPHATAPNDLQHFYSEPGLIPPAVRVTPNRAPASQGDIFVAPQYGPAENGPMILDRDGRLIWFRPYPIGRGILATDFRVQRLDGRRVLTWWQGNSNQGSGRGVGMIFNDQYRKIATVHAGNGLRMDLHEFLLTPNGDAYIVAVAPVHAPHTRRSIENGIVQEIDIKTGLVLFQWDALDHIPLSESVKYGRRQGGHVLDPYHINSVSVTRAGNLVVSLRNTNAVYGISRATGRVLWTLGGKHSSFRLGGGVSTAFQHDAVVQGNGQLTIFDDGAGPPTVHSASRGIEVNLNFGTHRATLVRQWFHSPNLSSNFEGSLQRLEGGDVFLGWGQQPYFSEVDAQGHQIFDAHFVAPSATYRAYRVPWSGDPDTRPAVAVVRSGSRSTVYTSWNGATAVASWRVLAGSGARTLHGAATRPRHGFETGLPVPSGVKLVAVQALDARGHVLATSRPEPVR